MSISRATLLSSALTLAGCAATPAATPAPTAAAAPLPAPAALAPSAPPVLVAELELANPSGFERKQEPVYLSYRDLGLAAEDQRAAELAVLHEDTLVPSQAIDSDGDGQKDGLLALVDLHAAELAQLRVVVDQKQSREPFARLTQAVLARKSGGEWRPRKDKPELFEYVGGKFEDVQSFTPPPQHTDHSQLIRFEGPGIESDKVGYRVYLDWRNGFDIFGKRVVTPVLQNVGLDGYESYHHLSAWGMDILKVGESLGIGGFGFWDGKKVQLVSQVDGWDARIAENGSLYSAFAIKYRGWKIDGKKLDVDAQFSMTGGSRAVHVRLIPSELPKNLTIGVVKHPETELISGPSELPGTAYTYLASWGKQSLNQDLLGMAVLFPKGALSSKEDDGASYAAVLKPDGNQLDYYFLAAWQGEPSGIQTREAFVSSLDQEIERLTILPRRRLQTVVSRQAKVFPVTSGSALDWAKRLADTELETKALLYRQGGWDTNRKRKPRFEYDIVGLQPLAYDELAEVTHDAKYAEVMPTVTGSYVTESGDILDYQADELSLDSVNPGRNLLRLYEKTKAEKYKKAAGKLRQQLARQPKTSEGAFWHKKKYPSQLWLDGVYMGTPFLASYSAMFEKSKSMDQVVNEFVITRKHLRNPETGLYFHAWDEKKQQSWADPKTGLSKYYWGRGLGWFAMALVDVLDIIPESDTAHRKPLLEMSVELAAALAKVQDPETGTWWQILDQPKAIGNYRESTATAMFSYFLAKGTRKKVLPDSYRSVAQRAFEGMLREFITVHADGKVSMKNQCLVAGLGFGRDGSYRYYQSEPVWENDAKGNGPFILAGIELHRLLANN
jgi:unsaturated rhamnogalacturonyl hydrolase